MMGNSSWCGQWTKVTHPTGDLRGEPFEYPVWLWSDCMIPTYAVWLCMI